MKQTAVEWLVENINKKYINAFLSRVIEQAKEIEKQQIIEAYNEGWMQCNVFELPERSREHYETPEQYYNETFNK